MSRCKAMAYTNDPANLVIRCELEEHETGSHASKKDLDAVLLTEPTPALKLNPDPLTPFQESFNHLADRVGAFLEGMKDVIEVFEPPKNLPHDPALRRDPRKWGKKRR